jgi:glycerol kinase
MTHILAIDQGTTSSRAILFDAQMRIRAVAQEEFEQHFPQSGWVEHEASDLWSTTAGTCRAVIEKAGLNIADVAAIGITNQRETTVVWDRHTGQAIHRAIVWQDRRTAEYCAQLREAGHEPMVTERTGLLLDPYFSGTKLRWILENVEGARGGSALWHGGFVPDLEADRGPRPCHRRHQCRAHAALRYPQGPVERDDLRSARHPHADAAGGARQRR